MMKTNFIVIIIFIFSNKTLKQANNK